MSYILSLDAGTTSIKGILFNEDGHILAGDLQEYNLITPAPDIVEIEPETYWDVSKKVIRHIISKARIAPKKISVLGISSQGETVICMDKDGKPLRKAIVWLDNRAKDEADKIKKRFGIDEIYKITGQPDVVPTWTSSKILWLQKNEPAIIEKTHKVLLVEDYLIYKLTGKYATERSVVSTTLYFNIRNGKWYKEMLKFIGISEEQLPELKYSSEIVGNISLKASKETGLDVETIVSSGAMDQIAGAIGAGNIKPGVITETTGTAMAICTTVDKPTYDSKKRLPCQYNAIKDSYVLIPWIATAGMVFKWFRDEFGNNKTYSELCENADKVPPGSDGLILLPHLSGASCPEFNPKAKGVFFGITLSHKKEHFTRAILESIAFMLKRNLEVLQEMGIQINEVISLGGAAKSNLWLKIKADVVNKKFVTVECDEAACLGIAMLSGVASGIFKNLEQAVKKMVHIKDTVLPDKKNNKIYEKAYKRYLEIYNTAENIYYEKEKQK